MVDEAGIAGIVKLLSAAAPEAEVFLFGSYASGTANEQSDLDLLVVEPFVSARLHEIARLKRALGESPVRIDLLVIDRATFEAWRRIPGMIAPEARPACQCVPSIRFGVRIWDLLRSWSTGRNYHVDGAP
jgi:predicted nucleotidyltransferase